jgi:hypothetical protein
VKPTGDQSIQPSEITRIFLRPIGTPLPLGFLALCGATVGVSAVQIGWVPLAQAKTIGLGLVVFVAPLQLLSAMYGFLARDPVAGTGMAVLAGTWALVGFSWRSQGAASPSPGLGVLLVVAAASMLVPITASVPRKVVAGLVMVGAAARLAVTGAYELGGSAALKSAAGWLGVALAVVAWYAALALEAEDARGRAVFPTLRFGGGEKVMTGSLSDEIEGVQHEAGVRQQL